MNTNNTLNRLGNTLEEKESYNKNVFYEIKYSCNGTNTSPAWRKLKTRLGNSLDVTHV